MSSNLGTFSKRIIILLHVDTDFLVGSTGAVARHMSFA